MDAIVLELEQDRELDRVYFHVDMDGMLLLLHSRGMQALTTCTSFLRQLRRARRSIVEVCAHGGRRESHADDQQLRRTPVWGAVGNAGCVAGASGWHDALLMRV